LLLAFLVRAQHVSAPVAGGGRLSRRFLVLIPVTGLVALGLDFFLVGIPVYVLDLGSPTWLPGALLALHTIVTSTCGTLAIRATERLSRAATLALGAVLVVVWCGLCLATAALPVGWRPGWLVVAPLVMACGGLFFGARVNAMAVELAPAATRGRHLAAFQYAFTVPGVLAPAVVGLFSFAVWAPWVVVAVCAGAGAVAFRLLDRASSPAPWHLAD
jgi:MFS family permease